MNLRELSGAAGLQAGSLYNYFHSKDDLLFRLITEIMDDFLSEIDARLQGVDDPMERLKIYIKSMVVWHSKRRKETYIGHMELRNLPEERYKVQVEARDRFEGALMEILRAGRKEGIFRVPDEKVATIIVISMLRGISDWYRPDGRFSIRQLVGVYTEMVLKILGAPVAMKSPAKR